MATQPDPWDIPAAQGAPQPLIARQPPPQTSTQVDTDAANLERIRLANEAARLQAAQGVAAQAAEAERKAAAFFTRALGSNRDYEATGVGPRSYVGETMQNNMPGLLNQLPASVGNSPERQVSDSAQNEFIAATLRQDSGAAIPEEELERQRAIYFPASGDSPQAIEQKRRARRRALEGLINSAGRSLRPQDRAAYEEWSAAQAPPGTQPTDRAPPNDTAPDNPGGSVAFVDEATPPERRMMPGGETFAGQLEEAVNSGRFRTFEDVLTYARTLNPAIAATYDNADTREAFRIFQRERARNPQAHIPVNLPYEAAQSPPITDARDAAAPANPLGMTGALGINGETVDATVRGAADVLSLGLSDEVAAGADTIFGRGGTYGENLWRQRGIDEYDTQNNWGARLFGQGAGSLAFPTGVGRATFGGARTALAGGATRDAARIAARRAGYRRLGMEGAVFGGGYGAGSAEGDIGDRAAGGALSAVVGGVAGYGLGRGMGAIAGRYGGRGEDVARADQLRAARSAAELDIRVPRSVIGGEQAQRWATTVEKTPFGAAPVARGTETMINDSQAARDRIASDLGGVVEPEALGDTAIRGGEAVRSRTSRASTRLYDEAERLTGDTRVPLPGAAAELDRQLAELADTPGVVPDMLSTLQSVRSRLDGDWTPASIRRMRTQLESQFGSAGMRPGDASRRARLITEAAEADMVSGLRAGGQADAAQAWRAASDNYRVRQETLERVIEPILGRNNDHTPEVVTRALLANAKGNGTRLGAFLREMPAEEAGTIRASIINQLGRSPPGQQNAAGEAFSLDTFLTHWDQIKGARHQIFPRETVGALNHLANVAERARFAGRARNLSNTGTPMMATVTASPLVAGATALMMGSPKVAVAAALMSGLAALAQNRAGALLASPRLARRLANTLENPANARRIWSGPWVAQLARTEPVIANDLLGLQQSVLRHLSGDVSRAAAESGDDQQ